MDEQRLAEIQALVEPILAECNMELVELTSRFQGGERLIRFLVDAVGGVTIQQCARANRLIGEALEAANLIEASCVIEVSSPGLDRPLVSPRDFERAIGEELQLEILREDGRPQALRGMLLAVQPEAVVLKMRSGNVTVPLSTIRTARKALRW